MNNENSKDHTVINESVDHEKFYRDISSIISVVVIFIGCLVLLGWLFNIDVFKSPNYSFSTVKSNVGLAFILIGISLWILREGQTDMRWRRIAQFCAFIVALLGFLTFIEYLFNWNLGIDQMLFKEPLGAIYTSQPNRMALSVTINLMLTGAALILLDTKTKKGYWPSQFIVLIMGAISFLALVGYLYDVSFLYYIPSFTGIALYAAITFMLILLGILYARPDARIMKTITSDGAGIYIMWRFLIPVIFVELIFGWLSIVGIRSGLFPGPFAISLVVVSGIIIMFILIWVNINSINSLDKKRQKAEEELQIAHDDLEIRVKERTKELLASKLLFETLAQVAPVGIFRTDPLGKCTYINNRWSEITGLSQEKALGDGWTLAIHPEDRELVFKEWNQSTKDQKPFKLEYRFQKPDGTTTWVLGQSMAEISKNKELEGYVGTITNINEIKKAENMINKSLEEKEMLLKEIHHRVKNNLMIISSLLNLQSQYIKDKASQDIFKESQNRARSMALIHERLYQSTDLKRIDFGDYIKSLSKELFHTYEGDIGFIELKINVEDIFLDINTSVPLGLIVNELITNSLKHAFPEGKKGEISVNFYHQDDHYEFTVKDDGIGFPEDLDFHNTDSLGLQMVTSLTDQIGGEIELKRSPGTKFIIKFTDKEIN